MAQSVDEAKSGDTQILRLECQILEDGIIRFEHTFKTLRKDVLAVTQHAMQSTTKTRLKTNGPIQIIV